MWDEWLRVPILLGSPFIPYGVKGEVKVKNNYINPEEGGIPSQFEEVWWGTECIMGYGIGDSAKLVINDNEIQNGSISAITMVDHLGECVVKNNEISMGIIDTFYTGNTATAILAQYAVAFLGGPATPSVGGIMNIRDNHINCGSQTGIVFSGFLGNTWSEGCKVNYNIVNMTKMHNIPYMTGCGIRITDVQGAKLLDNTVKGDGEFALYVGDPPIPPGVPNPFPLMTENNKIIDLSVKRFNSSLGLDVMFAMDAENNQLKGGKGTYSDGGQNNTSTEGWQLIE